VASDIDAMDYTGITPEWWLQRLTLKLLRQVEYVREMENWYSGNHPLPQAAASNSELFKEFQQMAQTNYLLKVVDAIGDRLEVTGIRMRDDLTDERAWEVWQRSQFDSMQQQLVTSSLCNGMSYISVWPDADGRPVMAAETAGEVTHERVPGKSNLSVAAALKVYWDEIRLVWIGTLWLPHRVYTWGSAGSFLAGGGWDPLDSFENPFGRVPIVPMPNRPTLKNTWSSEMQSGIPIQRRINQTLLNLMVAQESVAFPQRYVTGLEMERSEEGIPKRPFKSGPDSLWIAEDPDVKFGQFQESSFQGYLNTIKSDVEALAAATSTPLFNLSAHLAVPPSAEALNALESSLVKKAADKQKILGQAFEDALKIALSMDGYSDDVSDNEDAQVTWADPRLQSDALRADAAVKLQSIGVPTEVLWERVGASPQDVVRWRSMAMTQAFQNLVTQVGESSRVGTIPGNNVPADSDETFTPGTGRTDVEAGQEMNRARRRASRVVGPDIANTDIVPDALA
jgi:hypothetical protein